MAKLPNKNTTKSRLDRRIVEKSYGRPYLGMSGLGEECRRRLWYGFHWVSMNSVPARVTRIFNLGHSFEEIAISELKAIGIEVYKIEDGKKVEMTGALIEDQEELLGFHQHEAGHTDGRCKGFVEYPTEEMLLEMKSMKEQYFIKLKELGVQVAQPKYYAQTQRYMREKKLRMCFFLCINKNTSEYYAEFVLFDKSVADDLARKGRDIILSDEPLPKEYIEGYYKCLQCPQNKVCHYDFEPAKNCRTCDFSNIEPQGVWSCSNRKHIDEMSDGQCEDDYALSVAEQRVGCDNWKKGWGL